MSQLQPIIIGAIVVQASVLAFPAAVAGVITSLFAWISLQVLASLISQVRYVLQRRRALFFAFGSRLANFLYSIKYKRFGSSVIPIPGSQFSESPEKLGIKLVIIVPGTWSGPGYDWNRWTSYKNSLEGAGIAVYCLQWRSQNNEDGRRDAAQTLLTWLQSKSLPERSVGLIGHSYGGQVAAMVSSDKSIAQVVTIAAPFITSRKLSMEEIAAGAQAHFGRLFLRSLAAALAGAIALKWYLLNLSSGVLEVEPAKAFKYCFYTVILLYASFFFAVILKFRKLIKCEREITEVPQDAAKITVIRISRDEILDEMIIASRQAKTTLLPSKTFLDQTSLSRSNLVKWARPFFLFCWIAEIIRLINWPGRHPGYVPEADWSMTFGVGYFIFYFFVAWLFSTVSLSIRSVKELLVDLFSLVSYRSVLQSRRRAFVGWIAGVETHKIDLYAINIERHIGCSALTVIDSNVVKSKGASKSGVHSICVEACPVVSVALRAMRGTGQPPSSGINA